MVKLSGELNLAESRKPVNTRKLELGDIVMIEPAIMHEATGINLLEVQPLSPQLGTVVRHQGKLCVFWHETKVIGEPRHSDLRVVRNA